MSVGLGHGGYAGPGAWGRTPGIMVVLDFAPGKPPWGALPIKFAPFDPIARCACMNRGRWGCDVDRELAALSGARLGRGLW